MNLLLVAWPLAALGLLHRRSFAQARWITAAALTVELALGLAFALGLGSSGAIGLAQPSTTTALGPTLAAAVALIATVMMSARGGQSRWFVQILAMTSSAALVTGFADVRVIAVGWGLHLIAFGSEVWRTPARRIFNAHMSVSLAAMSLGAYLHFAGQPALGAWALAIGIAIRAGVLPAHAWLPNVARHVPLPIVVVFVAPQLGIAAHLELLAGSTPPGFVEVLAAMGAITAFAGALLGAFQTDARKALAYLLVSQSGLVAFGLEAHSEASRAGAILVWITSSVAFAGFASILAAVEARRGRLGLDRPSGNFERIPRLATAWLLLGLACVGLPGTVGFIAEDLLVEGTFDDFPKLAMVIILTTAINAIAVLRVFFGVFTGTRRHAAEQDMLPRERIMSTAVIAVLIGFGVAPAGVSKLIAGPKATVRTEVSAPVSPAARPPAPPRSS